MVFNSSVPTQNSYGVFWFKLKSLGLFLVLWINSKIGTSIG